MVIDFDKYALKGNEFVRFVALELEVPRDKASRIVRAVLHALRNKLSYEESFQLMAQLPMAIKGIYVEGWKYEAHPHRIRHLDEFLEAIREADGDLSGYDFGNNAHALRAVQAVFLAMYEFVSPGEMRDILDQLPHSLRELVRQPALATKAVNSAK
ncbi:MAG: DUF2267 domain-containing protein [Chitinophagia bacterium]|nr:DUF2267 domain-containing protein [Chitinophagia bacterium]